MIEHTIGASGVTARELQAGNLPPALIEQLLDAASRVNSLIGMVQIVPNDVEGSDVASAIEAMDALSGVLTEAWQLHSTSASIDFDVVREHLIALASSKDSLSVRL